jgi:hypothetical protein
LIQITSSLSESVTVGDWYTIFGLVIGPAGGFGRVINVTGISLSESLRSYRLLYIIILVFISIDLDDVIRLVAVI